MAPEAAVALVLSVGLGPLVSVAAVVALSPLVAGAAAVTLSSVAVVTSVMALLVFRALVLYLIQALREYRLQVCTPARRNIKHEVVICKGKCAMLLSC